MEWVVAIFLLIWASSATFLLVRASKRMLQFDSLLQMIVEPMQEYSFLLRKLTSGEGLLHDHPEVVQFHRANVNLLLHIEKAIDSVRQELPKRKQEKLPRPEAV